MILCMLVILDYNQDVLNIPLWDSGSCLSLVGKTVFCFSRYLTLFGSSHKF